MENDASEFDALAEEAAAVGADGPLPSVRRATALAAGGDVSALVWGRAPRTTLLHGAGLNAHTWDATLLRLGRDALAVDLPGHGDSDWREDFDYRPETNAAAVAATIDALAGGAPQLVVGHSLGGATAIALAAARPDLVSGLVLVDVTPGLRPEDARQVTDFLAVPMTFSSREQIVEMALAAGIGADRRAIERGVALNTRVREDGAVVFKHHFASPPEGAALAIDFTALWPALESSPVPVLLVRASGGFLPTDVVDELRGRVPRAGIVELDSGHNVQEQRPVELAEAIRAFADAAGA